MWYFIIAAFIVFKIILYIVVIYSVFPTVRKNMETVSKLWKVVWFATRVALVMGVIAALVTFARSPIFLGLVIITASAVMGIKVVTVFSFIIATIVGIWDRMFDRPVPPMKKFWKKGEVPNAATEGTTAQPGQPA